MKSNTTTILVAAGALLVGGIATAAFMSNRDKGVAAPATEAGTPVLDSTAQADDAAAGAAIAPAGKLEYADVLKVEPVTRREQAYATVIGSEPVRETTTTSVPREVCEDVVVQERLPERDGNVGGTVAGAVIGGLLGNQVGKGNGRKLATVAGAVGGGFAGREIDKRHVGGQVVNKTEQQCHTETSTSTSSKTVAWNVTYRNPDGTTGTMRMGSKPGSRIALGNENKVVAYDVTYSYQGAEHTVRMEQKPVGDRLPVVDGQVVTQTASVDSDTTHG